LQRVCYRENTFVPANSSRVRPGHMGYRTYGLDMRRGGFRKRDSLSWTGLGKIILPFRSSLSDGSVLELNADDVNLCIADILDGVRRYRR
jgi:hypothetical protein